MMLNDHLSGSNEENKRLLSLCKQNELKSEELNSVVKSKEIEACLTFHWI